MDYVTRQFINLTKKLRDDFRKLHESLHRDLSHLANGVNNLKDAVDAQRKPEDKSDETTPITIAEFRTQVPIRIEQNAKKSKPEWVWAFTKGLLEVAVGVAVIVYTCVSIQQWHTMQRQVEIADRPWVKDTVTSAFDFTAQNGGFSWSVNIRADNVGHSVATAIFPQAKLIAVPQQADFIVEPRQKAQELCNSMSKQFAKANDDPTIMGAAIFPGDHRDFPYNTVLWPNDVSGVTLDGGAGLGKSVMPMLIGCIEYHYGTSEKPHRTWFVYVLSHNDDPTAQQSQPFFSLGKTVPKDNVVLFKSGQFAD
jgi:hypothetical protein